MKLTRTSTYALQALAYMANQKLTTPIASYIVAKERGIPEKFLLKLLKPLVSTRVLISLKGPNGGYRLGRPADQISMLEVIEAVDGPIRGRVSFTDGTGPLDRRLEQICGQVAEQMQKQLGKVSIADLATSDGKKRAARA
jgi:Rrf2 family protein